MATLAFAVPLLPGKEDTDIKAFERFNAEDRDAYVAARRSQGFTREAVWHQKTPQGTLAIVVFEGDDIAASFGKLATSDEPFDRDFRRFISDVHGIDLANDPPPDVRPISDVRF